MDSKPSLFDIAAAVADGARVDWEAATRAASTDNDLRLLGELRFIANLTQPAPSDASPPFSWGPLKVIELVGRGSFGDVYRAWDSRLDREVALKILRRNDADDQPHDSTVIQEGRLLARVRHPNVVTVYGAERINGQVGVWMEFVYGNTLEDELGEQGPFDVDRVVKIAIELSGALSTVHRAGLVHGDVKTQNVLCDRDGRLVLTDFGAGVQLGETADTVRSDLAGTPLCVAPEVLARQPASPRSDLYSLAVLLYRLLTGTYPVRGQSLKELGEAHANGKRILLRDARCDLRDDLVAIIDRALDPDPTARHETLDTFHAEVSRLCSPISRASHAGSKPVTATRPRLIAAACVVLAVAITSPTPSSVPTGRADGRWPTIVPKAYELYLRGAAAAERGGQSAKLALQLFEEAVALDPGFAQPHAAIGQLMIDQRASLALSQAQRYEQAKNAAARALALDAQLPEAHVAAAKVRSAIHDWAGAEREYRRAIELAPNRSVVREEFATWLSIHGRFAEAIAEADRAVVIDRLAPRAHYTAGLVRRFARQCAEARRHLEKALELDPQYGPAHHEIGQCHQMAGRHDLAIDAYRRGAQGPGNLGHALAAAGRTAEARAVLAGQIERQRESGGGSAGIAMIYVGLGDYERALDLLDRDASSVGAPPTWKVAAVWDPLRSHPRFTEILRKRGLAPE